MKIFISKVFYLILLVLLVNTILYVTKIYIFDRQKYNRKYREYSTSYNSYLFADSHGSPLTSEKYGVYNFSIAAESYLDMERKINFLIHVKKVRIDTLYITVDDHTLAPRKERSNNLDRSIYYATRQDFETIYDYIKYKYVLAYFVIFQPKFRLIVRKAVWTKIRKLVNSKQKTQKKREMSLEQFYNSRFGEREISKELTKSLLRIIGTCKERNIILIGIKFPLRQDYVKLMEVKGNKSYGADSIFKSTNIPVMDYKKIFNSHDELFSNQDHLNVLGGRKFAKLLLEKNK
jgi:hypothetical protein